MLQLLHKNHFWALRLNIGIKQCMVPWCGKLDELDQ